MSWQLTLGVAAALILPAGWGWLAHRWFLRLGLHRCFTSPTVAAVHGPGRVADEWSYQI